MKKINDIINEKNSNNRKPKRFIIKEDRQRVKELFNYVFKTTDKTVLNYEFLPEYEKIIDWLMDSEGKGLYLAGNFGQGKSNILMNVIPVLFQYYHNYTMRPVKAIDINNVRLIGAYCIDDIGTETIENDYGTKKDKISEAIQSCEDEMRLLILSTNLSKDEIIERYGLRIYDRIQRLCKVVVFTGESLRK